MQEYLLSHPNKFHIPLRDYLFKGAGIDLAPVAPIVPGTRSGLSKAKTNPSVTWSNRGQPTGESNLINFFPPSCKRFL